MARDLRGRSIIITGASSGIGRATAIACADAGMDVVINARRRDRLEEVAERIESAGQRAVIVDGDCTDDAVMQALLERATHDANGLYAVFANAGVGLSRAVLEMTEEDLREIFDINFFASVALIQQAGRRLRAARAPGHLIMCSSCLAKFGIDRHGAYSSTKAAQNHICRSMRHELRGTGIEVASVHPITTRTEFFEVADERSGSPRWGRRVNAMPGMFIQPPEKVAHAIVRTMRRPRPEVWTSWSIRMASAVITAFPSSLDCALRVGARASRRKDEPVSASTEHQSVR